MGVLTTYTAGHNPIYYGSGYISRQAFWVLGLVLGAFFFTTYLAHRDSLADVPRLLTCLVTDINPRSAEYQRVSTCRSRVVCRLRQRPTGDRSTSGPSIPRPSSRHLTDAGWLAALIPEEYGGGGLSVTEASVILEEINRSGANSGACHAQMYVMGALVRHGSDEQKRAYLPDIAAGRLRLQSFAVTEPTTGTDTTKTQDGRRPPRRSLRRQRPEGVDLADPALRPDAAAGADDAACRR